MIMVEDIFKARADSFGDTMIGRSGMASLKLPEYQRPYDWGRNNVLRLLQDCLNGLKGSASQSVGHRYTFLGTVILTADEAKEPTFAGESLSIVDGQQRLTTLLLLSCALYVTIRNHEGDSASASTPQVEEWLEQEIREQLIRLYGCTTGQRQGPSPTTPFPRMVRAHDVRGHLPGKSKYESGIAGFLNQFCEYCTVHVSDFSPMLDNSDDYLLAMYQFISAQIERFVYLGQATEDDQEDEFDPPVLSGNEFTLPGCQTLFAKLNDVGLPPDVDGVLSNVASDGELEGLLRLLLFASYVVQSVVLAVVEAPNEEMAFDIFDALNTTGEPLTALETLKPYVVRFERQHGGGYPDSESESWWKVLEENVLEPYDTPDQRQKETKELVTGFALYYVGEKLGADLKDQRNTLRTYFTRAEQQNLDVARRIVRELGLMAQYRRQFWDKRAIDGLVGQQSQSGEYEDLKLCLRFISDSNTSTVIPILARYLIEFNEMDAEQYFLRAVKAVTAFLVLRRAITGGTAGIDSDFRKIMSLGTGPNGDSLCLGPKMTNKILSIDDLRAEMRALLAAKRFAVTDKQSWINRAREIPLGSEGSQTVCRFLLFAAAHNARLHAEQPGLMEAEGVIESDELKFLTHATWIDQRYATLEHVAPAAASSGWDQRIYARLATRHTLGNLVLLPERENQSIGNAPWGKKTLFYRALVAKTEWERENAIELAQDQGLKFGNRTLKLIRNQDRLHMLDPIAEVEDWTVQFIEARTENVLDLAWDRIAPWLFD